MIFNYAELMSILSYIAYCLILSENIFNTDS